MFYRIQSKVIFAFTLHPKQYSKFQDGWMDGWMFELFIDAQP